MATTPSTKLNELRRAVRRYLAAQKRLDVVTRNAEFETAESIRAARNEFKDASDDLRFLV